jgi:hypothetical protein
MDTTLNVVANVDANDPDDFAEYVRKGSVCFCQIRI